VGCILFLPRILLKDGKERKCKKNKFPLHEIWVDRGEEIGLEIVIIKTILSLYACFLYDIIKIENYRKNIRILIYKLYDWRNC